MSRPCQASKASGGEQEGGERVQQMGPHPEQSGRWAKLMRI